MIKLGTLFWLFLVSATGFAMFAVKYQVQAFEDELTRTKKTIAAEQHEIHVLDAEWAYLTQPETLEEMSRRHLSLAPIVTTQLHTTVTDIPLRPQPPLPAAIPAVAGAAETPLAESGPPLVSAPPASPTPAIMTVSTEKPAQMPVAAKPGAEKAIAKPAPTHRPKTLDDLIAQIVASR